MLVWSSIYWEIFKMQNMYSIYKILFNYALIAFIHLEL